MYNIEHNQHEAKDELSIQMVYAQFCIHMYQVSVCEHYFPTFEIHEKRHMLCFLRAGNSSYMLLSQHFITFIYIAPDI